jgi:2,3-bisphosphoglycerate-dependent phosphoglycerate mutase
MTALQCATTLVAARHAEAEYVTNQWTEGGSLTALGRQQAARLGTTLAGQRVAHVWTSPLARAVQTAEIVAARLGVGVTTRTGLREFDPGYLADRPHDVGPALETHDHWIGGELDVRLPGGETGTELVARVRGVLEEITDAHPGETVLVVSHGGTLRIGVPALCRMDADPAELENTATLEVLADADAWVCTRWG